MLRVIFPEYSLPLGRLPRGKSFGIFINFFKSPGPRLSFPHIHSRPFCILCFCLGLSTADLDSICSLFFDPMFI